MTAPAQVLQGEPFNVEVLIDSNHDDDQGQLEVYRGDIKVADQPVKLKKGENRVVLKQTIDAGGLTPITARLKGYTGHAAGQQQRLRAGLGGRQAAGAAGRQRPRSGQAPDLGPRRAEHAGRRPPAARRSRQPGRAAKLRPVHALERAGDGAQPAPDGSGPHLRARPGRRADDAGRRPVVRPGRLLQDQPGRDPAGAQRFREGEGKAEPGA